MSLILTDAALDWALAHALRFGDTDIFPEILEFKAIEEDWSNIKGYIQRNDILEWKIRPTRRCLVPKHRFGFRISTEIDPLDFLVFTSLTHEVGEKLEASRIPTFENIVHSYRFAPSTDGRLFSEDYTYRSFQSASRDACIEYKPTHVVIADIADFFPRLYTHRIDNALDSALGVGHMHAEALKSLIGQWAGTYSYGIPVGSTASRLIAEVTISDIDQILLSEKAKYVRYSDDFRIFCKSEGDAYKYLTLVARYLFSNHGLTLQQNKTKIIPVDVFRDKYLRENEKREVETLSERFYDLLTSLGIEDTYSEIDYDSLSEEGRKAIDELNLENILKENIAEEEPDLPLLKFLLRRLGQLGDADVVDLIFDNFSKFVPVIRETINYILRLEKLPSARKKELGKRLIAIYRNGELTARHLEYTRMYMLVPFAFDMEWNSNNEYVDLYNESLDEFSGRTLLLAMGRSKMDYWFRSRKQTLDQMTPWVRRAFIYSASCLPPDEYKHWIRGIDGQLDVLERAITTWARKQPVA